MSLEGGSLVNISIKRLLIRGFVAGLALLGAIYVAFDIALSTEPPPFAPATEGHEFYFAYGSNMSPQYLSRIRAIEIQASEVGVLYDYRVSFNLSGIPVLEPSFANLAPKPGALAYGIVHKIDQEDISRLKNTEGSVYVWKLVPITVASEEIVMAWTLVAPPSLSHDVTPSRRYLTILHAAAVHFDFPDEEIEKLSPAKGGYVPIASEALGTVLQSALWIGARIGA